MPRMTHKVRKHYWANGILQFVDQLFEKQDDAIAEANSATDAHNVKVYDDQDQVVHEVANGVIITTYA
jgi:hypothetical protein